MERERLEQLLEKFGCNYAHLRQPILAEFDRLREERDQLKASGKGDKFCIKSISQDAQTIAEQRNRALARLDLADALAEAVEKWRDECGIQNEELVGEALDAYREGEKS